MSKKAKAVRLRKKKRGRDLALYLVARRKMAERILGGTYRDQPKVATERSSRLLLD